MRPDEAPIKGRQWAEMERKKLRVLRKMIRRLIDGQGYSEKLQGVEDAKKDELLGSSK